MHVRKSSPCGPNNSLEKNVEAVEKIMHIKRWASIFWAKTIRVGRFANYGQTLFPLIASTITQLEFNTARWKYLPLISILFLVIRCFLPIGTGMRLILFKRFGTFGTEWNVVGFLFFYATLVKSTTKTHPPTQHMSIRNSIRDRQESESPPLKHFTIYQTFVPPNLDKSPIHATLQFLQFWLKRLHGYNLI